MIVVQRKTGKILGECDDINIYGRYYSRALAFERCFTSISFRLIHGPIETKIIAFGYRDASLLPGFKKMTIQRLAEYFYLMPSSWLPIIEKMEKARGKPY